MIEGGRYLSRVREAARARIPYAAVLGDREAAAGEVSLRPRDGQALDPMPARAALRLIGEVAAARSDTLAPSHTERGSDAP